MSQEQLTTSPLSELTVSAATNVIVAHFIQVLPHPEDGRKEDENATISKRKGENKNATISKGEFL